MGRLLNWFTGAYTVYGLTNDAINFPTDFKEMVAVGKTIISDIIKTKGHMEPIASKTHPPKEAGLSEPGHRSYQMNHPQIRWHSGSSSSQFMRM